MSVEAWAAATSCPQGGSLRFTVSEPCPVTVTDVATGRTVHEGHATAPTWTLDIPATWPSSLYRARFGPPIPWPYGLPGAAPCPDNEVHFVVRQAVPSAPILVSVPFTTWQAYNRAGHPGEGLYWTEAPDRARRVSFDRPGGGPPPERWEEGLIRWLRPAGYDVAYCANLDLDHGLDLLEQHRLLVVNGHDEYWSAGMRDAVEEFVRRGGNLAVFSGNTAWWQIRLEDGGRTMVCHRDPLEDPTAEWSAADRPENGLTGTSFRAGAGTWGPHMKRMLEESYTVRFAGHWAFEGTGLTDGDKFGQGCLGYETDAAEFEEIDGVPRVTARDGTPPSFVVLATADLRHWAAYGQGGMATMGVFTSGLGTVFNAATVNWGNTLHDPVVERVTRNVLDRLSAPRSPRWEVIGPPAELQALAVLGRTLYAADPGGRLLARELCGQNLPWRPVRRTSPLLALAVPREAAGGVAVGLHALTADSRLLALGTASQARELDLGPAPAGAVALAIADCTFYVATTAGRLWSRPFGRDGWQDAGPSNGARCLAGLNGRLFATGEDGELATLLPGALWEPLGVRAPGAVFTAAAGRLISGGAAAPLRWRPVR
ncbi:N,N-dimethylformamidase beta subunit family domain-containing protein [Nonomuraea sp. NPDC050310]|uniref:N,N-dimethylformamidase beta subunit family domain-containing protein n=1 Tax=Nonomuraea sp. NPDC050310 TaxID=3154935 RepID=UPI0033DA694C